MSQSKTGHIVWHDLFTQDRARAMAFYQRVANWSFQVERATDFAWGGGEKNFVLALCGQEAGAGFVETTQNQANGWIAYIEVPDVDAAVTRAAKRGGQVVRHPFEVPGVGRNALVRDPLGALLGMSLSRHSFPVPRRQFGPEIYLTNEDDFPEVFYADLFGWRLCPGRERGVANITRPSGDIVATCHRAHRPKGSAANWVPGIKSKSPQEARRHAEANGAHVAVENASESERGRRLIFLDPDGALFSLTDQNVNLL